jgi:bifunctional DNA-binding transcriptional regulator/antitoxin component of YhaV-PrlF toxin-antitoxin module
MTPKVKAKAVENTAPATRRGRTTTSRLSSKNQITLPVDVIRKAGFEVGDELKLTFHGGKVTIEKKKSGVEEFAGSLPGIFENYDFEADRRDAWGE